MAVVVAAYRNRVRACRLRALVRTQKELAERTGIHRSTISLLESNRAFLSAPHALAIRDALGCSLDDLYEKIPDASRGDTPRRPREGSRGRA